MGIHNTALIGASSQGYQISRSVRTRSSASAYLNRTPATTTNRKTFTYSLWVKRGILSSSQSYELMNCGTQTISQVISQFTITNDKLSFETSTYGVTNFIVGTTTAVFRDPSAWYHLVFSIDTTQATNSNGVRIYVNGVQQTLSFSAYTQNYDTAINTNAIHDIGQNRIASNYFDGYLTEINFIDGQALTPSSFGETNAVTGVWQPKKYAGTYGTNGFYLNFSDNSAATAAAIGKDNSGNGNNWTPNNISVTAGATYDSMLDTPTPFPDGGNGRGNYSVINPLSTLYTVTAGNLDFSYTNSTTGVWYLKGTLAVSSGKYYWEVTPTNVGAGSNISVGIVLDTNTQTNTTSINLVTDGYVYHCDGNKYSGASGSVAYGATYTNNDVIGVALDLTAGTLVFYKNNVSQGTAYTGLTSSYLTLICNHLGGTSRTIAGSINAGQRPFTYTPPSGFVALNTQNLPVSTIFNGANHFAATTYTGTGATQSISNAVNGVSFQPDFVWFKSRATTYAHALMDSVRGVTKAFESDSTAAEQTSTAGNDLSAFTSTGFTVGAPQNWNSPNNSGSNPVAWQWNAGGSTVTNTSGSISAQVRANPTAGFSVVTYTGTGANATVGHGLGVAPKMVIVKHRDAIDGALVYHSSLTSAAYYLLLTSTAAQALLATAWNSTAPTSSVFSVGTSTNTNQSTGTYVAYCFAAVAGYSAFGSYTGNGSTDGPFVYLGFRPRFLMIKRLDSLDSFIMEDSSRNTYNVNNKYLLADSTAAEGTATPPELSDFLSNGFKKRSANQNTSSGTYAYAAFAENPFKYANAR